MLMNRASRGDAAFRVNQSRRGVRAEKLHAGAICRKPGDFLRSEIGTNLQMRRDVAERIGTNTVAALAWRESNLAWVVFANAAQAARRQWRIKAPGKQKL
jgi:hypothetical protein